MLLRALERQSVGLGSVKCQVDGEPGPSSPTHRSGNPRGKDTCSPQAWCPAPRTIVSSTGQGLAPRGSLGEGIPAPLQQSKNGHPSKGSKPWCQAPLALEAHPAPGP